MSEVATIAKPSGFLAIINPETMEEAHKAAELLANSGMVPDAYKGKPGAIVIAGAMGHRLGLDLFSSLAGIAVINGRPSIWGDMMLAVCQQHPSFEDIHEVYQGDPETENYAAFCTVKRRGREPYTQSFSFRDAKVAGLWGKQGPWTTAPRRMIQMRARAFVLRTVFADALAGFTSREEADDMVDVTASATVHPAEPKAPVQRAPVGQIAAPEEKTVEPIVEKKAEPVPPPKITSAADLGKLATETYAKFTKDAGTAQMKALCERYGVKKVVECPPEKWDAMAADLRAMVPA